MAKRKTAFRLKLEELKRRHDELYPPTEKKSSKKRAKVSPLFNGWTGPSDKFEIPAKSNQVEMEK